MPLTSPSLLPVTLTFKVFQYGHTGLPCRRFVSIPLTLHRLPLSLPVSLGPTQWHPALYDSTVYGLMRLLGTSPPPFRHFPSHYLSMQIPLLHSFALGFCLGFSPLLGASASLLCFCTLYALAPGLRCRGTSWFRYFTFALADAWLGFVLAMFALVLLLRFTKPRIIEWNLSVGRFTRFTFYAIICLKF